MKIRLSRRWWKTFNENKGDHHTFTELEEEQEKLGERKTKATKKGIY